MQIHNTSAIKQASTHTHTTIEYTQLDALSENTPGNNRDRGGMGTKGEHREEIQQKDGTHRH